jgi:excisionase family DNA binding protein
VADREADDLILLTRAQAARRCGVSVHKFDEWTHMKGFPVLREERMVRIHAKLLDEWLAERATGRSRGVLRAAI